MVLHIGGVKTDPSFRDCDGVVSMSRELSISSGMKSETLYFALFTALCVAFVPVYFFYGLNEITVPLSAIVFDAVRRYLLTGRSGLLPFALICMGLYVVWFMIIASLVVRIARRMREDASRVLFRRIMLALVCGMSFVPMITYSAGGTHGGTYNFWTAVWRYFEHWS